MAELHDMTWDEICEAIAAIGGSNGQAQQVSDALTAAGVELGDTEQAFKMLEDTTYQIWYNSDGSVRTYNYVGQPDVIGNASGVAQLIDSNAQTSTKTAVSIPLNTTASVADPTKVSWKAGVSQAGSFVVKEILPAIAAANVGITLGKTIDSALYNANPDFWDSHGWGSINPETWASITRDDDSLNASLFNAIFKIDPTNNTTQTYLDQNAVAYLALVLQQLGVFNEASGNSYTPDNYRVNNLDVGGINYTNEVYSGNPYKQTIFSNNVSYNSSTNRFTARNYVHLTLISNVSVGGASQTFTYDGKTVYYSYSSSTGTIGGEGDGSWINPMSDFTKSNNAGAIAWAIYYGGITPVAIEGIGTQEGATTPTLSDNDTVAEVLAKLQTQYPSLFSNAITQDVVQPDGSISTYTYLPVSQSMPIDASQTQPISTSSTQADPEIDPETATQEQLAYIISLLTDTANPNLENTGDGNTPAAVVPTGSASALYTVYNPTESEVQSFGGWLWSANFVDQLLKMFNDPMQAIISLHKVFCTPSTSGRNNIKVGYLDSGVAANVVNAQYVDVQCGTVSLSEYFKNVFDYQPYTEISLYLPFVGFVRLDVNDVMRANITITYHIDVLTGACLVDVDVVRDLCGGVLYQYAGDCSVHYPLSSGSYMGIVTAILGIAGTVASGGAVAPMVIGVMQGAAKGRTAVERSGNLSANAGAMGIKKPYLVIQRPQVNVAENFDRFLGKPANQTTKIGSCTGFISCLDVHIENCNGTDSELQELEKLLKEGILI